MKNRIAYNPNMIIPSGNASGDARRGAGGAQRGVVRFVDSPATGENVRAEVHWISDAPVRLAILPRPRGGDYIEDEVASLAEQGVEVLVSLLMGEEVAALELTREAEVCSACGVRFLSLPIEDRGIPVSHKTAGVLIQELCVSLRQGRGVGVHCRAGIGRSATIAAAVLTSFGVDVDEAFAMIAKARGCEVPDTAEQRDWVVEYATRMQ